MDTSETTKVAEDVLEAKGIAEIARDNALDIATDLLEGTSFYKHTQDIGLASKNSDGTINSIINLGSDGTAYIGGRNIVLDGNTIVDGTFTITDEMIAPYAEIDGAKIADATIGSAKIANLDVSKISGDATEFVQSYWNSIDSTVQMTGDGFDLYIEGSHHGGLRAIHSEEESSRMGRYGKRSMSLYAGDNAFVSLSYQGGRTDGGEYNALSVLGYSGEIEIFAPTTYVHGVMSMLNNKIHFEGGSTIGAHSSAENLEIRSGSTSNPITFHGGNTKVMEITSILTVKSDLNVESRLNMLGNSIRANRVYFGVTGLSNSPTYMDTSDGLRMVNTQGSLRFYSNNSEAMAIGIGVHMYIPLNMNNNPIHGAAASSDERLKNVHGLRIENDLEKLMLFDYKNFSWERDGQEDFGFIAQQVQQIAPEIITEFKDGYLGYWSNSYVHLIGHAVQQLALREENTNKIASQALQSTETNEEKIHALQQELSKANRRIEELESVM